MGTFGHGFTYSGHPVCTAVALRNLELMEERDVFGHAARMGERFQARLKAFADHPLVGEARGVGLIGAIELMADPEARTPFDPKQGVGAYCMGRCEAHGLLVRALGDSLAFCPPLIIDEAQVDEIFDAFGRALEETEAWLAG